MTVLLILTALTDEKHPFNISTRHPRTFIGILSVFLCSIMMACGCARGVPDQNVRDQSSEVKVKAERYWKSCNAGEAEGCFQLGMLVAHVVGPEGNQERASMLFAKACKAGHEQACIHGQLKDHYAIMLRGLAAPRLPACDGLAPAGAVHMSAHRLFMFVRGREEDSDMNTRWDLPELTSPEVDSPATDRGMEWFEHARALLSAPATLVVEVIGVMDAITGPDSKAGFGTFTTGSVTARQVRFDARGIATCERRRTLHNSSPLVVPPGSTVPEAAMNELRGFLVQHFGR